MPDDAEVAALLVSSGCVRFDFARPFRFASGLVSPMYCDCRLLLGQPGARARVASALEGVARSLPGCSLVAGVATAGVPLASIVADRTGLPLAYVRSAAKDHGTRRLVEGGPPAGASALLVEDAITTGGSSLAAVRALRDEGAEVLACAVVFSYGFAASTDAFAAAGVDLVRLTGFAAVARAAVAAGLVSAGQERALHDWWREAGAATTA